MFLRYTKYAVEILFRFDKPDIVFHDYNIMIRRLAKMDCKKNNHVRVISIDATDASITDSGCRHFSTFIWHQHFNKKKKAHRIRVI